MNNYQRLSISVIANLVTGFASAATTHAHHQADNHRPAGCSQSSINMKCARTITSTFDPQGRLWSTWSNNGFLYVSYSDNNGSNFSLPVKVNRQPEKIASGNEHRPKIQLDHNNHIYLSWTTKLNKRFTGNIRFSYSIDQGKHFSHPQTINSDRRIISHRFDAMTVNRNGEIFISWLDKRNQQDAKDENRSYSGAAAYYAYSGNSGKSFSRNIKLADNSCECCRMAITTDTSELPVVMWRHVFDNNIRDHQIISFKDINTPESPYRVSYDQWQINGCPHHGPSITVDNANRYHAVWFNNAEKRHGIFYGNSEDRGKTFSNLKSIGDYSKQASHADIITNNDQLIITWREFHKPESKILVMRSNDHGKTWSAPETVASSELANDYPFLIRSQNRIFLSWHVPGENYYLIPLTKK